MKILYFTDPHLTAKSPASRQDIYYQTTLAKMCEIGTIIADENINMVVCGGDMFHTPNVSLNYAGTMAQIIKTWGVPVIALPGNHDIFGYNLNTIFQTMLGMYAQTGVVRLLTEANPVKMKVGSCLVAIEGREYSDHIDDSPDNYEPIVPADFNIVVNHGMLLDKPFLPDVRYTLTKDIINPADVTLGGHYHYGFTEHKLGDSWFFNPGSLLRVEASKGNMNFRPKVIILELLDSNGSIDFSHKYIELKSAAPGSHIFDYNAIQTQKNSAQLLDQFKQFVTDTSSINTTMSIEDMITRTSSNNSVEQAVMDEALLRVSNSQVNDADSLKTKGFVENHNRLSIKSVHLENFQSHSDTIIDFANGFNVIIGESNSGKTSILRGLQWVLYNEPRGSDFIRTGADKCSVTVNMSDGSSVTRSRTRTSAGSYSIKRANGTMDNYSGFGNDVPMDVFNVHQMPIVELSKDIATSLNVASQLDGPFLISLNQGDKANAIGRIIGSQVLDSAIKDVSKDAIGASREISSLIKLLDEKNAMLPAYSHLASVKNTIDEASVQIKTMEVLESDIAEITSALNDYQDSCFMMDGYKAKLIRYKGIDDIILAIEKAKQLVLEIESLESLRDGHFKCSQDINRINISMSKYADVDKVLLNIEKAKSFLDILSEAFSMMEKYGNATLDVGNAKIKLDSVSLIDYNEIERAKILEQEIAELNSLKESYDMSEKDYIKAMSVSASAFKTWKKANTETEKARKEFRKYLKDNNICPLCNSSIDDKQIEHMVGEV